MNKLFPANRALGWAASIFLLCSPVHAEPATPLPSPTPAPSSVPGLRPTYDSFRLVHTRNVFDPDRRPVRPAGNAPAASAARADYAALTGTLLSAEKTCAFFSGSRPEFNKVLAVRDKIANATITGITSANIEIERDGKRTVVAVGQTVPFDNQTAPGVPPADAPAAPAAISSTDGAVSGSASAATTATTTAGTTSGNSTAPKGAPPNLDDVRRRMMEKRKQELK